MVWGQMGASQKIQSLDLDRIYMADVSAAGHCALGTRRWFEGYGLDFRKFLREGIDTAEFLATRDGHAQGVYEAKLKRVSDGQQGQ